MMKITLNSISILFDELNSDENNFQQFFDSNEIICIDTIKHQLFGHNYNDLCEDDLYHYLIQLIDFNLKIGRKLLIKTSNLKKRDRNKIVRIGQKYRVPIFYVLTASFHNNNFYNDFREKIKTGEGCASVVDLKSKSDYTVIRKFDRNDLQKDIQNRGFLEFCVVGDVHGMYGDFKNKVDEALKKNQLLIQLGDIIDYGPDPVECVELMYKLVMNGLALFIIGNHERKLFKYLKQRAQGNVKIDVKGGLIITIEKLSKLTEQQYLDFEHKFYALFYNAAYHAVIGNKMFVHASTTPTMWNETSTKLYGIDENRAVFGLVGEERLPNGYPQRLYTWVDEIPNNHIVYIGHDIKDNKITIKQGKNGGTLVFTDTGSGKGGVLSSVVGDI